MVTIKIAYNGDVTSPQYQRWTLGNYETSRTEISEWCCENCAGRVRIKPSRHAPIALELEFDNETDATLFSLRWL